MTETSLARNGRTRHWLLDAGIGGVAALGAITLAHAALPEPLAKLAPEPAVEPVAPAAAPAPESPTVLIAFTDPLPEREVASPFGLRKLPWEEDGRLHAGVDLLAPAGTPVRAAADGVVIEAGTDGGYGRYVAVRHAEGLTTVYAHLGGIGEGIVAGRALKAGTALGKVGSSGTSTGPHLHFEIRDAKDRPLNPALFLGRAFAEADDLPLKSAQRFGRRVRVAYVSTIPKSKRAQMQANLEREADEKELRALDKEMKRAAARGAHAADEAGVTALANEHIDGLRELKFGEDGRPRAQLSL